MGDLPACGTTEAVSTCLAHWSRCCAAVDAGDEQSGIFLLALLGFPLAATYQVPGSASEACARAARRGADRQDYDDGSVFVLSVVACFRSRGRS